MIVYKHNIGVHFGNELGFHCCNCSPQQTTPSEEETQARSLWNISQVLLFVLFFKVLILFMTGQVSFKTGTELLPWNLTQMSEVVRVLL